MEKTKQETNQLTPWQKVEIARNPKRKTSIEYIEQIFDEFIELHGDRNFKDDQAIISVSYTHLRAHETGA